MTYERCEELSTLIDDTADDNFIEVSCSVTSYPKSILTWTTDPINRRGYPIKETNKVRLTPVLGIKPLFFARMKIFCIFMIIQQSNILHQYSDECTSSSLSGLCVPQKKHAGRLQTLHNPTVLSIKKMPVTLGTYTT